jgi:hypothetical protein
MWRRALGRIGAWSHRATLAPPPWAHTASSVAKERRVLLAPAGTLLARALTTEDAVAAVGGLLVAGPVLWWFYSANKLREMRNNPSAYANAKRPSEQARLTSKTAATTTEEASGGTNGSAVAANDAGEPEDPTKYHAAQIVARLDALEQQQQLLQQSTPGDEDAAAATAAPAGGGVAAELFDVLRRLGKEAGVPGPAVEGTVRAYVCGVCRMLSAQHPWQSPRAVDPSVRVSLFAVGLGVIFPVPVHAAMQVELACLQLLLIDLYNNGMLDVDAELADLRTPGVRVSSFSRVCCRACVHACVRRGRCHACSPQQFGKLSRR